MECEWKRLRRGVYVESSPGREGTRVQKLGKRYESTVDEERRQRQGRERGGGRERNAQGSGPRS